MSFYTIKHRRKSAICICNRKMILGFIQQGSPKCGSCAKLLINSYCFYCPTGNKSFSHPNGFFMCERCANNQSLMRSKKRNLLHRPKSVQISQMCKKIQIPVVLKQGWMQKKGKQFCFQSFVSKYTYVSCIQCARIVHQYIQCLICHRCSIHIFQKTMVQAL